jgi:hypothetical protein
MDFTSQVDEGNQEEVNASGLRYTAHASQQHAPCCALCPARSCLCGFRKICFGIELGLEKNMENMPKHAQTHLAYPVLSLSLIKHDKTINKIVKHH